jgi:hypothetical protein
LMDWGRDPVGQALINQAAKAGDDGTAYFKEMLRYRANPADPEALAIIKNRISGGELPDGRWVGQPWLGEAAHMHPKRSEHHCVPLLHTSLSRRHAGAAGRRSPHLHLGRMQALRAAAKQLPIAHQILQPRVPHTS